MLHNYKIYSKAKINLFLHIIGKNNNDYHLLESMVCFTNDIYDIIEVSESNDITLEIKGEFKDLLSETDNIILKAANFLRQNLKLGAKIILTKNIPIAAGIGGGSSNAASIIKLLIKFWNLNLDHKAILNLQQIGADVPCCFYGKSTLFKILLGEIEPDSGKVTTSSKLKMASVSQEVPNTEENPVEFLLNSDIERKHLFDLLENSSDSQQIADIYEKLIEMDAYSAESKASIILKGLGFSEIMQKQAIYNFSGGYRMRIALATALFLNPDLLLLDEPTNHLDLESIIWLEEYLKNYSGSLIIISHEREFLNKIVNNIFHLKNNIVTKYRGNYNIFEEKYQQKLASDLAFNKKIEAQKAHMQKFVDKFRYKATKAKQAQSRLKAISKLNPISILDNDQSLRIQFPEIENLASPIISFDKVNLGYENNIILNRLGGSVANDDRIAILGANGQGKSTFCKMLAGELKVLSGKLEIQSKLSIGYFNQHQYEILDLNQTPIQYLGHIMKNSNDFQIRTHLGSFGFSQEKANTIINKLSGGEKARLVFAVITLKKPQILILDEPTNHLDIEMRESLILALNDYQGAIILISHDTHLIEHTVDDLWIVENKTLNIFNGSLEDYRKKILKEK